MSPIKALRSKTGKTLEEIGQEVGVSKTTVQRWESGAIKSMRCDKLARLARVLNTSPIELLKQTETQDTEQQEDT